MFSLKTRPPKTLALQQSADKLGKAAQPPLAIKIADEVMVTNSATA